MKKGKELQVSFVTFYALTGDLIDIELYRSYRDAARAYERAVRKEFAGIKRHMTDAVQWEEKKDGEVASIKWRDRDGRWHGVFIQVGIAAVM